MADAPAAVVAPIMAFSAIQIPSSGIVGPVPPIAPQLDLSAATFTPNGAGTVGPMTGLAPANLTLKGWLTTKDPSGNVIHIPYFG